MKFKLDENLGARAQHVFRAEGHDVQTVRSEGLEGGSDQRLYELCCAEQRCLVSLDLDFAGVIRFPPSRTAGIVVIRVPRNPSLPLLEKMVGQFLKSLARSAVEGQLWIVEVDRIRVHQPEEDRESK